MSSTSAGSIHLLWNIGIIFGCIFGFCGVLQIIVMMYIYIYYYSMMMYDDGFFDKSNIKAPNFQDQIVLINSEYDNGKTSF